MVDLADEVSVSWVLGYIVDQHILKKDKKAQQNAEDSDDKSGNSGTGEMAVSAGKPCTESRCGSEYDLNQLKIPKMPRKRLVRASLFGAGRFAPMFCSI